MAKATFKFKMEMSLSKIWSTFQRFFQFFQFLGSDKFPNLLQSLEVECRINYANFS